MINATTSQVAATRKVKIVDGRYIEVDGVQVGHLEGRGEIYVILGSKADFSARGEAVARFKRYLRKETARTLASRWVKFVLARMDHQDVMKKIGFNQPMADRVSPMQLAWDLGMPKPERPVTVGDTVGGTRLNPTVVPMVIYV